LAAAGHLPPTGGLLSGRVDHDCEARSAADRAAFFVRPLCQAPRLEPPKSQGRSARTLASRQAWQGQAEAGDRADARGAGSAGRLQDRHRAGVRHRCGRDGAVVAARRAAGHDDRLGILRRGLGRRHHQGTEAEGRHPASCRLWRDSRSREGRLRHRHHLHLERHHLRRARAQCRLDQGGSQGSDRLRCDLGGVRANARLGQARCRHLLLAEGAGRRGRARHAGALAPGRRTARDLQASLAAAENLPHDQGRQAQCRHLRGRDHQHAVDALRRGLSGRFGLGQVDRRIEGADGARRRQHQSAGRLEGAHAVDRFPREGSRHAVQHLGVPEGDRSRHHLALGGMRNPTSPRSWSRWSRRRTPASTSPITAMRPRACASGVARPWKQKMSSC